MNNSDKDGQRWHQVETLFHAALEKAPEERGSFLDDACGGDVTLRREVDSLLAADAGAGTFLERGPGQPPTEAQEQQASTAIGRVLGPYKLIQKIGEGGMSTVYQAIRVDDEYRSRVAIKLIGMGIESEANLRRFRIERQILAGLDHPYVARLLDGGTTEEGLPYLVMEYVEGIPIDQYCDRNALSIRQRLELFLKVCSAVQYAHQNLVVHRDLKPSNMLVRSDGMPKLLDFGIAKLLNPDLLAEGIDPTRFDIRMMTPEYASPEQVRGEPITTASDVYSLGIVLYKLLTGERPYDLQNMTLAEIERVVCEQPILRPSVVVTQPDHLWREVRTASPAKLRRLLSGDLDNIVLKALRKEPERRYASAEALAEDVRRHLSGRPVTARADSFAYRAGKFIQRNRVVIGLVSVVVGILAVFAVALSIESARTAKALERAEREALKAKAINQFLQETLGSADPQEGIGRQVSVLEVLERAVNDIDNAFGDQPEIEAAVRRTIGVTYRGLGRYDEAEQLLSSSLRMRQRHLGERHPDVAESMTDLALVLGTKGEIRAAERLLREALTIYSQAHGDRQEFAEALYHLGALLRKKGTYDEAETALTTALPMLRDLLGEAHPLVVKILRDLAATRWAQGRYSEAEELYREALDISRQLHPQGHPQVASVLNNLAIVVARKGDSVSAETLFREALGLRRTLLGQNHPATAETLSNLAGLLFDRGEEEESEKLLREALAIHRSLLGREHPDMSGYLNNLARILVARGDYDEAEKLLWEAVTMQRERMGQHHPDLARYLSNLAGVLVARGAYTRAEELLEEALEIDRRILGENHPEVTTRLENLALVRQMQQQAEESR